MRTAAPDSLDTMLTSPVGIIRVYTTAEDRVRGRGFWGRFIRTSVPHLLVINAKSFGLPQAVVLGSRFGFLQFGPIDTDHFETGFKDLPLCVEIVGDRALLEAFCAEQVALLEGRMVIFRRAETWTFPPDGRTGDITGAHA